MGADPEPHNRVAVVEAQGAVIDADANRPKLMDLLEVQRGVMRISFEKFKVFVGQSSNGIGETPIMSPEAR